MTRLKEIEERLAAIKVEAVAEGITMESINALKDETTKLQKERSGLMELAEQRKALVDSIITDDAPPVTKFDKEERTPMTKEELLASPEYRSAFFKKLQGKELTEVEKRAYTDAAASAGAAIPTATSNELFAKMVKLAPMLSEITLLRVSGNITFAMENVRNAGYQHTQNAEITSDADTLTSVTLGGYEFTKLIRISKTVQTMSINAFESWIVDMLAEDIARLIENAIINGSGSTAPKGIAYCRTFTTTYEISTTASIGYDDVMDLIALLPAGYDSNAKFLCNKKFVYSELAKIKEATTNAPILVKDMEGGLRFLLMGYPVLVSDKVTDGELYLGDYKKMVGNLPEDINVQSSDQSGFIYNAIDFRGSAIFDCDCANPAAIVRFKKN